MIIGVPKEVKNHEYRAGLLPHSVKELVSHGHQVLVETMAGVGMGVLDADFEKAGAKIVSSSDDIFKSSELIIKVKEPTGEECDKLSPNQILFTFLHLAPIPEIAEKLINSKAAAIAYETVTDNAGRLPLLAPMSEVAGRLSIQVGATYLEKARGGRGMLLGGVPGVGRGNVVIIGGGVVGSNALKIAIGMGAHVTILDKSLTRLNELDNLYGWQINTKFATSDSIAAAVKDADLLIGAVLIPGASAPRIVTTDMVKSMNPGSVIVDVAIDQGGCIETSHATSYDEPVFEKEGVLHYCVANMPGGVPRTSAFALNNATLPFILNIANKGLKQACIEDKNLLAGLNVCNGAITHRGVSDSLSKLEFVDPESAVQSYA